MSTCEPTLTSPTIVTTAEVNDMETGNDAVLTATFRDDNGVLVDPAAITLAVRAPDGTGTTYTLPGTITRLSAGVYRQTIDVEVPGKWLYRWSSPSTPHATASGSFKVTASAL